MAHITFLQLTSVLQRIVSWATGKFAAKNTYSGKLEYADMPVVVLASMGSELDGTSTQRPMSAGDTYYLPAGQGAGARIMFVNSIGSAVKISDPVSNVIYCNAYTGLLYRWDASESDMVSVGGTADGDIDVSGKADLLSGAGMLTPSQWPKVVLRNVTDTMLDDLSSGDIYFDSGYLFLHTNGDPVSLGHPNQKTIYYCLADGHFYRWNGNTFQLAMTFDNAPTANSNNPVKSGGVYTALATKANSADLASVATSGSYNDLSNKPTLFSGNYNDLTNKPTIPAAQVNADWNASSGVTEILNKPTIPTKFSDLVDDSDYIKAEDVASIVVGSADVVITETPSHICITFVTSSITFTPNTTMSLWSGQKVGTLTVSGTHLKQDITLTVPANFTAQVSGGTAAQSITIPQTGGEVSGVSVTITYKGANSGSYTGSITATSGSTTASVGLVYSQYQGATIIAGTIDTIKAAIGGSQVGELNVSGVNLEDDISASVGNGDFTICATQNGTYGTTATISKASAEASGGATLYVKYTPSSGTSTASGTLTLKTPRNGVLLSKTVDLTGAVNGTLSISPATASIGIASGGSGTAQYTVVGAYLTPSSTANVSVSGTGFSVAPATLTADSSGNINAKVTVTFSGSSSGNGTLSVSHADVDTAATAAVVGSVVTPLPENASFKVGDLYYKVNSDQQSVRVWNGSSESSDASSTLRYKNDIVVPASVSDEGVTATLSDSTTQTGAGFTYAVTELANSAFRGCSEMTSLTLPEGLLAIGSNAIYQCTNNSFTTLTIPSTVTTIGGSFLSLCSKLVTVNMLCAKNPDFQTSWGAQYNPMLRGCTALTSFVIPDNVTSNYSGSFDSCSAMQSITLGKDMGAVLNMFSYLTNVTEIICRGTTTIPKINMNSKTTYTISQTVFDNATLKVPRGYKQAYLDATDGRDGTTLWSGFANIEEYDLTD